MGKCANCQKRRKQMKETIGKLTENEIKFCGLWTEVIKNPRNIPTDIVVECYKLVFNQQLVSFCPSCISTNASHLNNYFNNIRVAYNKHLEETKVIEPIVPSNTNTEPVVPIPVAPVVEQPKIVKRPQHIKSAPKKVAKKLNKKDKNK